MRNASNVKGNQWRIWAPSHEPRRYGFPFLSEKIITPERNGKTCNEARMSYGCGPVGRQSRFQGIPF